MTNLIMTVKELKTYGFDIDANSWMDDTSSVMFTGDTVDSYFENDVDSLEEISGYKNKFLEIVATFENGIVTGFSYAYGPSEDVGAHNNDDLNGVIEWLRR